jgi:uncharacterized membrane protein
MNLFRKPSPSVSAAAAAVALVLFVCSWLAIHHGWFERGQIVDTPVYEEYGDAVVRGELPYRDFSVAYPPGALPTFVLPALGHEGDSPGYRFAFETLMVACGAALLLELTLALSALGASAKRLVGVLSLAAVSPLLLGSVVLTRFDSWPAAVAAAALAALLSDRPRLGHGLLGAGVAVKIWPGVLVPLAVAYAWRTRGRREALICLAVTAGVVAAVLLPFVVLAPHGVWRTFEQQATRPLQVESLGAALIVASHHLSGTGVTMISSDGSQNVGGTFADVVGAIQGVLQVAVLLAIWVAFARRERSGEELVQFAAATVVAFIALGKVLSPQFMIWLIPFVPLVRKWSAAVLFVAALVLTQAWFPQHYWQYALGFSSTQSWLVLARDLVLLGLLVVLVTPRAAVRAVTAARARRRASSLPA